MFVSIISAIETILLTVPEIQEVHDFDKGKFAGYPSAVIFPTENTADFETTTQNLVEYVFTIRLHHPMENMGSDSHKNADRILRETVDKVLIAFNGNFSLNSTVSFCKALPSTWGYQQRDTGILRVAEIKLNCVQLETV